jgi:hypothetical protein
MNIPGRSISMLAAMLIAAQPCAAADLALHEGARQSGAFAGAYVRLPLTPGKEREEARAGVKLGVSHLYRGSSAVTGERRVEASLVDVGLFQSRKPSLLIGGRQMFDRNGRFSLQGDSGGGGVSPWLIGAGVVLLAVGVGALVLADRLKCREHDDEC